uniref:Uncharacterized LOC112431542 n=1 Tax=Maylandia zebra TaxID=106582 RepID=A0A3P9DHJ7_9CICH
MSVYSSLGGDSSSLWTFILFSALLVWTPVQVIPTSRDGTGSLSRSPEVFISQLGEVVVIGSNLPIIAAPGDDVILPCHLAPMFDVQGLTVEWSKPDLKPDPSDRLSRVEYVHLYRDRKEVPDMKMASYFRRTELFMDDMKHGNISLKILNVSEEDNGRYRCFIPKLQSRVKAAVVELVVGEKICFGDVCGSKLKFLLTIYDSYVFFVSFRPKLRENLIDRDTTASQKRPNSRS